MSIKFTILGCGSSMGVPRSDGYFGNCDPANIKKSQNQMFWYYSNKIRQYIN